MAARRNRHDHKALFKMYEEMGESRSLEKLSGATGVPVGTLGSYSTKYKWWSRLKVSEDKAQAIADEILAESKVATALVETEVYLYLSNMLLKTLGASIDLMEPSGDIRDIKAMLEVYRLLNNQPTEIQRQETATIKTDNLTKEELNSLGNLAVSKLFGDKTMA